MMTTLLACLITLLACLGTLLARLSRNFTRNFVSCVLSRMFVKKSSPNWLELPQEVTLLILQKLDVVDILGSVQRVCTKWESICKEPSLWKTINFESQYLFFIERESIFSMFRQAVDRSCGGLINLHLSDCDSGEFLDYVTKRCRKIRRLRLVQCFMSEVGLCEAAKRLPLLEDLEISYCDTVTARTLYKFGECCPLLKSLKKNKLGERNALTDDSEAMSIAKNMVELRHLQLFGNQLSNKGLKAILDRCSHLESLDLRHCFNLDLDHSSLGIRCQRIKDFRKPLDSTDDYEFHPVIYYPVFNATGYNNTRYDDAVNKLRSIFAR